MPAMSNASVFTDWKASNTTAWGNAPLKVGHNLHTSPLFAMEALAELIERYPRQHYSLIAMGAQGGRRFWREGDIGGLSGAEVIEAIRQGRMWINLRNVPTVDARYRAIVEGIFRDLEGKVPGLDTFNHGMGILISSPKAQVYYHADLPGQSLWQIHGVKRVYLYPNREPFLTPEQLEGIALFGLEVDMPYQPAFDAEAEVHDLAPGQMLHWPLNAPHRVENHDCLNVSMTIEYWTDEIRRSHQVNVANAIMRHKLGVTPRSRALTGAGFLAKRVLQRALRDSSWVKQQRSARRPVSFRLDPERPGAIIDLPEHGLLREAAE
jgi:hypothetical protein